MPRQRQPKLRSFLLAAAALLAGHTARAQTALPDGDFLTPTAAPGAVFQPLNPHILGHEGFTAGQAVSTAISPDGKTLLILTSGYNLLEDASGNNIPAASNEYVFVYDVSHDIPVERQVLQLPNSYVGLSFAPGGNKFYVSGGVDDEIHVFARGAGLWAEQGTPISLGHYAGVSAANPLFQGGVGFAVKPETAGLAVTADGTRLLAANFYNDSVSIVDLASGKVRDVQLRPGLVNPGAAGEPGGEYPFGVAVVGNNSAYVSSARDREVDVLKLTGTPGLVLRIAIPGNPNKMILNKAGTLLYVAAGNADEVFVIDTISNRIIDAIPTIAPAAMVGAGERYRGVLPNSLTLSPDESTLYVTDGGTNAIAVIALNAARPQVVGLIPTGFYPNAVSVSRDGAYFYAVNGKSPTPANPGNCSANGYSATRYAHCASANQYILQLSKAGFLDAPVPSGDALAKLTRQVAANDHFGALPNANDEQVMAALRQRIKHVIYIIRENRTYDQVLGDLGEGNGDPRLAEFGATITPNAHALARGFVDLDNFFDTGEVSGNGWPWSTSAQESDTGTKNLPVNYAGRGLSYDWEGTNRNVDVAVATLAQREAEEPLYGSLPDAVDLLPGTGNVAAPDGPNGERQRGYLWDAAMRAGLSVRNYGFLCDLGRYSLPAAEGGIPELTDPYASRTQVAFSANPTLAPVTDIYYRGFDTAFPDFYREAEWQREFGNQQQAGSFPNLTLLRLMHDHLGSFGTAIDGVNTPEIQVADNDYAVAKVVQAVARSRYAGSTLIFIVEDDAQDGPDHVAAHRSEAYVVGPYVRRSGVVSTHYTTVNLLRTIEDILGIDHLSIHDADQRPMTDVFDLNQASWSYTAQVPAPLNGTSLPIGTTAMNAPAWQSSHSAAYWAALTRGFDWHQEDDVPSARFNLILWRGLMPGRAYPALRSGVDYDKVAAAAVPAASLKIGQKAGDATE